MEDNGFEKSETISGSFFHVVCSSSKVPTFTLLYRQKKYFIGHLTKDIFDI